MIVVNFFHSEWASARGINGDTGHKTKTELDANLRLFHTEAQNKDGENNSRSTLLGFRNGLERYLNNPPYKKGIHIVTDPAFQQSNQVLDAKPKNMKRHREQNVKHKTCHWAWRPTTSERERRYQSTNPSRPAMQRLVSCHPVFLSTWTGRAKKLDEVQFSIPPGWKQQMVRNHGPWKLKRQAKHAMEG